MMKINNLVVNWHLLEPCQYKCQYCYAQWDQSNLGEVYQCAKRSKRLIKEFAKLAKDRSVRLSLAGGEPLLDKKISEKIALAHEQSLEVSIITNGDLLDRRLNESDLSTLAMLGVSIDSFKKSRNIEIGRATVSGKVPDCDKIIDYLQQAKKINPSLIIKINTVVNRFNWDDDLSVYIEQISPDKWKVLRVLPATEKSKTQTISDEQFAVFRATHQHLPYAQFEDNTDMLNSYLMVDPYGRFFFNLDKGETGYGYSDPILDVGIEAALAQVKFDERKFINRYNGGS